MLRQRLLGFAVMLTALALGANAVRANEIKVPFAEVAQTANLIFIGTVESQSARMNDNRSMIFTDVTFADVEVVNATSLSKQKQASRVQLTFPGGTMDGIAISLSDSPRVEAGRRYVLFAFDDGIVYMSPLVGGSQGLFEVVRDGQTGEEFVLTAGRHAVLEVEGQDLVSSSARVAAVEGGRIVPESGRDSHKAGVEPPVSADGVRATQPVFGKGGADARPLTLRGFVDQIRTVSLKTTLTERKLRFGDAGQFLTMVDGKVVAESLKQRSPRPVNAGSESTEAGAFKLPEIPLAGGASAPAAGRSSAMSANEKTRGSDLGTCGYQNLYIVMEQYPTGWVEWDIANECMFTWNLSRDVFRYVPDDGTFDDNNDVNEFGGYPDSTILMNIYGFAWGGSSLGKTISRSFPDCGRIVEADVFLNPAASWSNDPISALGTEDVHLIRPALMHELGHVWGEQRGDEAYDYDVPTVMHGASEEIGEDGWGVHAADAWLIRALYDYQDVGADVGVESYYAEDGLNNSTITGGVFLPGDLITLGKVTVENMSNFPIQNVNVRFYLSTNRVITTGDRQMGSNWSFAVFGAEDISVFDYPLTIPSDMPPGTYFVGAIVTINGFEDDNYVSNNATFFMDTVTVLQRTPPPRIDRVDLVTAVGKSFKLKMFGGDIQPGMRVFLGNNAFEWTNTRFKNNSLFVIKGGEALKEWFPVGVEVPIRLVNPSGGETLVTLIR
jgi:hypothetical protein